MIYRPSDLIVVINNKMNVDRQSFTVHEFGITCRSKKEVYDMLTIHGGYYLPPIEQSNADYISDILSGEKIVSSALLLIQAVRCSDVINRRVPQIEGLAVAYLIKFAEKHIYIQKYVPNMSKYMQCERKWLVNVSKAADK